MAITVLYLYHSPESKSCVGTPARKDISTEKGIVTSGWGRLWQGRK
jgi:hypothetical protein